MASTAAPKLRWGILSAAGIANKVHLAITQSASNEVVAVASRSLEKAQAWAKLRNIPKAYGTYAELLTDAEIDAIYIPLPTTMKCEWAVKCANAGKHVLVEKPFASAAEIETIVAACQKNNVVFMDGTMWPHNHRTTEASEVIKRGDLGVVKRARSSLAFTLGPDDIRTDASLEPLGSLGDIGWYTVRAILWAFDFELPFSVNCFSTWRQDVPDDLSAVLTFTGNRMGVMDNSFSQAFGQFLEVSGTEAHLRIHDIFLPFKCDVALFPKHKALVAERPEREQGEYQIVSPDGIVSTHLAQASVQEVRLFDNFATAVRSGETPAAWLSEPLAVQKVLDALYKSAKSGGEAVYVM